MNYKKSRGLLLGCVWGGFAIVILCLIGKVYWAEWIGLAIMVLGLLQALVFYKCPGCGGRFPIRGKRPDQCPKCGCKMDW